MTPKYRLITYGCQMNKNDSERIEGVLRGIGFEPTENNDEADCILINTCSVRQSAEDRVFGQIRSFRALKEKNPKLIIGVTGCMPGRDRDGKIQKKLPIVDLYFSTRDMVQLPRWIAGLRPELVHGGTYEDDYMKIRPQRDSIHQAFVSIQTGCNNFCTYCVVPFARGLEKNRPLKDILDEIREFATRGCIDVTLLGQTVNSYQAPDPENFSKDNPYKDHFAGLLWEVNQIRGITRLHFTAPHPNYMNDEVIDAMTLPAHVNYIHLPVQAGDDEVLRRMNRRYSAAQFFDVIDRLQKRIPGIAIGTDIIVGFCGETPEAFEKTVALYEKVRFDISYTARYSVRSGTAAWRAFKDDVSLEEKKRRWDELQEVQERIVYEKNQAFVGKVVSVLVDRYDADTGMCYGNSREMKLTRFQGTEDLVGKILDVKVMKAQMWILEGEYI